MQFGLSQDALEHGEEDFDNLVEWFALGINFKFKSLDYAFKSAQPRNCEAFVALRSQSLVNLLRSRGPPLREVHLRHVVDHVLNRRDDDFASCVSQMDHVVESAEDLSLQIGLVFGRKTAIGNSVRLTVLPSHVFFAQRLLAISCSNRRGRSPVLVHKKFQEESCLLGNFTLEALVHLRKKRGI